MLDGATCSNCFAESWFHACPETKQCTDCRNLVWSLDPRVFQTSYHLVGTLAAGDGCMVLHASNINLPSYFNVRESTLYHSFPRHLKASVGLHLNIWLYLAGNWKEEIMQLHVCHPFGASSLPIIPSFRKIPKFFIAACMRHWMFQ